jgi:hypothetical protein
VCSSTSWDKGDCVKQLWAQHAHGNKVPLADTLPNATHYGITQGKPYDAEIVEQAIDWMEAQGMALLPWQAQAFRAIMLSGEKPYVVSTRKQ